MGQRLNSWIGFLKLLGGFLFENFLISPIFRGVSRWLAQEGGLKRVRQRLNRQIGFLQFLGEFLSENFLISTIFRGNFKLGRRFKAGVAMFKQADWISSIFWGISIRKFLISPIFRGNFKLGRRFKAGGATFKQTGGLEKQTACTDHRLEHMVHSLTELQA